jgi:glyoxylate reductase
LKILVTRTLPSFIISKLEAAAAVDVFTGGGSIPADELRTRIAEADALVCLLTETIDRVTIDTAPRLKVIANVAVGYNNIDVAYARQRGVVVTNTKFRNVPTALGNDWPLRSPGNARPEQFFFAR